MNCWRVTARFRSALSFHLPKGWLLLSFVAIVPLLTLLCLSGCSNRSIFTGLDVPDTEKISRYTGEKLLNTLELNENSEAFYRALTLSQRERILSTLNAMIQREKAGLEEGELSLALPRSANAAVELLIHTNSIVYDMIYNLTDPALSALSFSGITMDELYVVYTDAIRAFLPRGVEGALVELATAFYDLYRISIYYQDAVASARYGVYSGGDLQTYVLAGILGGLIQGTQKAARQLYLDYREVAEKLSDAYGQLVAGGTMDKELLVELLKKIAQELAVPLENLIETYKLELELVADIFEAMAANAGYSLLSQTTARTIRSWGE